MTSHDPVDAQQNRLRLERDFLLRMLELGAHEGVIGFLREALDLILGITGSVKGYIQLDDGGGGHGVPPFWMASGFTDQETAAVRQDLSTGIIAEAMRTGRTITTVNALQDPRFQDQASVQALRLQAVLCAPIGGQSPMGVLYLEGGGGSSGFGPNERLFAELFARHVAPLADRLLARERREALQDHTAVLRQNLRVTGLAGTSRALADVLRQIAIAAPVPVSLLITGESGTGKTAVARAVHDSSPRHGGPFVDLNCSAIPETLFESELFGAEKGAHSTATRRIDGKIEAARGGTLLLDEVGDLPLAVQGKLLTFLQSRRYYRLGGTSPVEADVRVIAATNADLPELVSSRRFREDLYYRLNVLEIPMPPLRAHKEDIPQLADSFLERLGTMHGNPLRLSRSAIVALEESDWPGNVRQLENVLQRGWAVAVSQGASSIEPSHLFPNNPAPSSGPQPETYEAALRSFQRRFLSTALEEHGWNVSETGRQIGLARSHLNELIRAHGLSRSPRK